MYGALKQMDGPLIQDDKIHWQNCFNIHNNSRIELLLIGSRLSPLTSHVSCSIDGEVRRETSENKYTASICRRTQYGSCSVMLWGMFSCYCVCPEVLS
ncbi:hypothetical protein TNCV_4387061 [Trichonephila clavipes]|nr:hypothetical protein TNCV_4387061 [Trichonephila clavipes]